MPALRGFSQRSAWDVVGLRSHARGTNEKARNQRALVCGRGLLRGPRYVFWLWHPVAFYFNAKNSATAAMPIHHKMLEKSFLRCSLS